MPGRRGLANPTVASGAVQSTSPSRCRFGDTVSLIARHGPKPSWSLYRGRARGRESVRPNERAVLTTLPPRLARESSPNRPGSGARSGRWFACPGCVRGHVSVECAWRRAHLLVGQRLGLSALRAPAGRRCAPEPLSRRSAMRVPVTLPNRSRAILLEREPIRLLDVDPDLGAALALERRAPAERALVVNTCCLQVRAWKASRTARAGGAAIVLDGRSVCASRSSPTTSAPSCWARAT